MTKKKEVKEDFLYIFLSVLDKIYLTLDTSLTKQNEVYKGKVHKTFLVMITWRKYLFPYRTQKSSSNVPTIFAGYPAEKIGCRQFIISPLAQLVERSAVNRQVVGSSPTRGATRMKVVIRKLLFFFRPIGVTAEEARMLTALKFLRFQWKQKQKH